jgi:hypothetical protein
MHPRSTSTAGPTTTPPSFGCAGGPTREPPARADRPTGRWCSGETGRAPGVASGRGWKGPTCVFPGGSPAWATRPAFGCWSPPGSPLGSATGAATAAKLPSGGPNPRAWSSSAPPGAGPPRSWQARQARGGPRGRHRPACAATGQRRRHLRAPRLVQRMGRQLRRGGPLRGRRRLSRPRLGSVDRYGGGRFDPLLGGHSPGARQVGRPSDQRVAGVAASAPTAVFAQERSCQRESDGMVSWLRRRPPRSRAASPDWLRTSRSRSRSGRRATIAVIRASTPTR